MGELIAKAVYAGVREAVYRQNGVVSTRDVFHRLSERNIHIFGLISMGGNCRDRAGYLASALEEILLDSRYVGFVNSSLSLSDDYENGLIRDLGFFILWCRQIANEIAGGEIGEMADLVDPGSMPVVIRMSLNALLNGIYNRGR